MSAKQNTDRVNDLNKPYEENVVGVKGILWFGVGLVALIVITFVLMWALLNVLMDYSRENAGPVNPMAMNERERLPPEPRLQSAPGFGIDSPSGRVNLELGIPQAEYRQLLQQWQDLWEHGARDEKSGIQISLPIEEAKERLLQQGLKTRTGAVTSSLYDESRLMVSEASSGRVATERIR